MAVAVFRRRWLVVAFAAALPACVPIHDLTARASDEWVRSYPLAAGGELRITNTNGKIEIDGTDGSTIEVRAERIARGATEAAARELLPRIVISEEATPQRVSLQTQRISGVMIGVSFEVRYHVRAPKNATINVTNTNGQVALTGLAGRVIARTTNGGVKGDALAGAVDARSTNGQVAVDMASLGAERVFLRTTNGGVVLTLPESAKADLSASVTNGGISVGDFQNLDVEEKSRRRLEAKLNGGGTPIELQTTNGGVRIRPRNTVADTEKSAEDGKDRKER